MSQQPSIGIPRRSRPGWLRTTVVAAVALMSLGLSGCGEPDDDGGGGDGGSYLTRHLTAQTLAPAID